MENFEHQRQDMVAKQIASRGVSDNAVLDAMLEVPRERFVPGEMREFAYADAPLTIEEGQTGTSSKARTSPRSTLSH